MDKKSKIILMIFILLIIVSVSVSFYKYIYLENINFFTNPDSVPSGLDPIKNLLKI